MKYVARPDFTNMLDGSEANISLADSDPKHDLAMVAGVITRQNVVALPKALKMEAFVSH